MSKIICDVCGTSYPETATQCPICGCVRPGDVVTVAGNTEGAESQPANSYTYVKGGRFSKKNVKKRNQTKQNHAANVSDDNGMDAEGESSNKGLLITVIVLFLAIVAVVIYIALRFLAPPTMADQPSNPVQDTVVTTTADTVETTEETEPVVPCTDMVVSNREITFEKAGAALLLNVTTMPKNTTDPVEFATSDEKIATVTSGGKVTAVSGGEAVITITCGNVVTQCNVVCDFEAAEAETTEPTTDTATGELELNREDFTMTKKGENWKLYTGDIPADQITWTSDNTSVVTVKEGVVTAVGKGMTTVHAEYNGKKVSCIVRCAESVGTPEAATDTEQAPVSSEFSISSVDVTIRVDETFALTLKDKNGDPVSVTWTVQDGAVCSVTGNNVTGLAKGMTTVSAVHEGVTYTCIVRVS